MTLKLYAHPFSSYCQKVLVALYENRTPFEFRALSHENPQVMEELAALWPMKRFPVLVDAGRTVIEASIIIEHLGLYHPGSVHLLPEDARTALEVRCMDRFFDNYISTPQQKIVGDSLRLAQRDHGGPRMGSGQSLQPGRLRRCAVPVLCGLDASYRFRVSPRDRVPATAAGPSVICTRR
jgi:glutathione S-transferase